MISVISDAIKRLKHRTGRWARAEYNLLYFEGPLTPGMGLTLRVLYLLSQLDGGSQ